MERIPVPSRRAIAASGLLTLVGVVGFLALPGPVWIVGQAVLILGVVAVVVCGMLRLWRTRVERVSVLLAVVSAIGLVGAIAYLRSLDDEPSAIPLGGFGALLLCCLGLLITSVTLWTDQDPRPPKK